jgi:hypothetical protein
MIIISYILLHYLWKLNLKINLKNNNRNQNRKAIVQFKTTRTSHYKKCLRTSFYSILLIARYMYVNNANEYFFFKHKNNNLSIVQTCN